MIDPARPDYTNTPVASGRPRYSYTPVDRSAPPCVTIVTPFYNAGAIFEETAYSVLRQSLQQWEWLIVNDGSTEPESLAILNAYRSRDPRIRVIDHGINVGLSAARNTGFQAARTPYVVQLDSDDLLEPTAVEKWGWFLESHPEWAFVKGYSVGFGAQEYLWAEGFSSGGAVLDDNLVNPTSAVRKAVHQAVGGYDEGLRDGFEDWDFWLRCASYGYWGGTVPEYLDWYRRRPAHSDRWANWDNGERQQAFQAGLRRRYARLWEGKFPKIQLRQFSPQEPVPEVLPWENGLRSPEPRLLLLLSSLSPGEVVSGSPEFLERLSGQGWAVSVSALQGDSSWLSRCARFTADVFIPPHFLRLADYPRFLHYLLRSRQVAVVLMAHAEGEDLLLPYLRAYFPEVRFVDLLGRTAGGQREGKVLRVPGAPFAVEHITEKLSTLLQELRRAPAPQPPPTPSSVPLQVCVRAIEYGRLAEALRKFWPEPGASFGRISRLVGLRGADRRTLLYFAIRRFLLPYYRAARGKNEQRLLPLKQMLKRALLG